MIPDDVEALALADAIGALEPDEQRQLQARLKELPPPVREEVTQLYDLAVVLAATAPVVEPPPTLRERLLTRLGGPSRDTLAARDGEWSESGFPGIRVKVLAIDRDRQIVTMLVRAEPGARYPAHRHSGAEECYVLSGSIVIDGRLLRAGDFHHADAHTDHGEITTTDGADVLIVGAVADYLPSERHPA